MSGFTAKKFDIRVDLERKLAEHCAKQRITQKDYINGLIERDLVESVRRAQLADEARNQRELIKVAPTVETARDTASKLDKTIVQLRTDLPNVLHKIGDRVVEALDNHIGSAEVKAHLDAERTAAIKRNDALQSTLSSNSKSSEKAADERHSYLVKQQRQTNGLIRATRNEKRRLVLIGAVGLLAFQGAYGFIFPATALARWASVRLMGEKTELNAATVLAGSGERFDGYLMSETIALLKDEKFNKQYGRCVDRAKKTAHDRIDCYLSLPSLVETS